MRRAARLAVVLALAAAGLAVSAAAAQGAGATYTVLKCHVNSRSAAEAQTEVRGAYSTANRCAGADQRLEIANEGYATAGQTAFWRFNAPAGTELVGVAVRANLRRDAHHLAQLVAVDAQGNTRVLANGLDTGEGYRTHTFTGLDHSSFVVHLVCSDPGGCADSEQAHAYAQNIELVLADRYDPVVTSVSGGLVEPGWKRGSQGLQTQANDLGSGLELLRALVNGGEIRRTSPGCNGLLGGSYASVLAPCPAWPTIGDLDLALSTSLAPFRDGTNSLTVCAEDFAGNAAPCTSRTVLVDNSAPRLAFTNRQDPADPELIRVSVSEPHSGVDSAAISYRATGAAIWTPLGVELSGGELRARVDSFALPPGEYEFRAEATDVAGNRAETTRRADGTPMVLSFPLRDTPTLSAGIGPGGAARQTVRYGGGSAVSGRLVDPVGDPLAGREIVVTEDFGSGALIDHRTRVVSTDAQGRWTSKLPAGPSRTVSGSFAGSTRLQPVERVAGRLIVRSRASFRTSRSRIPEGGRVVFAGKVGHYAARMPSAGKLVELQVQESAGRWNTVREAFHTSPSGGFRLGYRFGRFYESDARFKFRVKVAREQAWPYKAPVRSRARAVTVVAR